MYGGGLRPCRLNRRRTTGSMSSLLLLRPSSFTIDNLEIETDLLLLALQAYLLLLLVSQNSTRSHAGMCSLDCQDSISLSIFCYVRYMCAGISFCISWYWFLSISQTSCRFYTRLLQFFFPGSGLAGWRLMWPPCNRAVTLWYWVTFSSLLCSLSLSLWAHLAMSTILGQVSNINWRFSYLEAITLHASPTRLSYNKLSSYRTQYVYAENAAPIRQVIIQVSQPS